MRILLATLLTTVLAYVAGMFLPWWSIAIIAFPGCLFTGTKHCRRFLIRLPGHFCLVGRSCFVDRPEKRKHPFAQNSTTVSFRRILCVADIGYGTGWCPGWWFCRHGRKLFKARREKEVIPNGYQRNHRQT